MEAPAPIPDPRVRVSLPGLVALQHEARGFSLLPRQPVRSLLAGRHASRIRGRGLDFEELRAYRPGDDIRTVDWRATARTGKPQTRVFTEERDRPVLVVVDQRIQMLWGTRERLKSVTAAEAAAIVAWRALQLGDRVGAIVFDDDDVVEIRPQRSSARVTRILEAIVRKNCALRAESTAVPRPEALDEALDSVARLAGHDHLVLLASDFDGLGNETERQLLRIARHNDIIGLLVHDPSAEEGLPEGRFVVSGGDLQFELTGDRRERQRVVDFGSGRIADVLQRMRRIGVPAVPVDTVEPTARQLRRLVGGQVGAGARGGRK